MKTKHIDLIERIFTNNLSATDEKLVEELMSKDVSFRKSLELQYDLYLGFEKEMAESTVAQVVKRESTIIQSTQPNGGRKIGEIIKMVPNYLLRFAASILIIACVGAGLLQRQMHSDVNIAQRHYVTPPNPTLAGPEIGVDSIEQSIQLAFFKKDYLKVTSIDDQLVVKGRSVSSRTLLYLANAHFCLEDYAEADIKFNSLLLSNPPNLSSGSIIRLSPPEIKLAKWNHLLTRLALGQDIEPELCTTSACKNEFPNQWVGPLQQDLNSFWR